MGVLDDVDLTAEHLEELCESYYKVYADHGKSFPQDAWEQVKACIGAVFGSWNSDRAIKYREINQITSLLGTACNIQAMYVQYSHFAFLSNKPSISHVLRLFVGFLETLDLLQVLVLHFRATLELERTNSRENILSMPKARMLLLVYVLLCP